MSEYIIDMGNLSYQSTSGLLCADVSQLKEEIVRCRDCKRFHTNTNGLDCPKLEPDGFCAWGEREAGG